MAVLQAENERLIEFLAANRIEWRLAPELTTSPAQTESSRLSTEARVALFRRRFRGRTYVYPLALGEQVDRQVGLCTCLCGRVARWSVREARNQVRRLSESLVDPAFGRCHLRPLGR